jgi:glutaredoxin
MSNPTPDRPSPRTLAGLGLLVLAVWGLQFAWQDRLAERVATQVTANARPGDIRMVSSATCPFCTQARAWLTAQNVPFSECFIETDLDCAAQYTALLAPGTPVLLVRGQRQVGFSAERVATALQAR